MTPPQRPPVVFLTITDDEFFYGTVAAVNSIFHYYPDAAIVVVNNNVSRRGLRPEYAKILTDGGVRVLNAVEFVGTGGPIHPWTLKAYAAGALTEACDLLVGIDSDCVLCGPIDDFLQRARETGRFCGGHDRCGQYDESYRAYGIETPVQNEKYMSTSLYAVSLTEENVHILHEWAQCCANAQFAGGRFFPGTNDQDVLNAILFKRRGPDGVELSDNHLWSQHWQYWNDELVSLGGKLVNKSLGVPQRTLHCGGKLKFWRREHIQKLASHPGQRAGYLWMLACFWFGKCRDWSLDWNAYLADDSRHVLLDFVDQLGEIVATHPSISVGMPSSLLGLSTRRKEQAEARMVSAGYAVLPVRDRQRSARFFAEVLGLSKDQELGDFGFDAGNGMTVLLVKEGEFPRAEGEANLAPTLGLAVVEPIEKVVKSLEDRGVNFPSGIQYCFEGFLSLAYFKDPDGNNLCLFQLGSAT